MATKIINVQRNDTFEEVFDVFKNASADEIIFIFPRGSRFGRDNGYFETIKKEASVTGKLISIMTTDPLVTKLAETYGFSLLQSPVRRARPRPAPRQPSEPELETSAQTSEPEPAPAQEVASELMPELSSSETDYIQEPVANYATYTESENTARTEPPPATSAVGAFYEAELAAARKIIAERKTRQQTVPVQAPTGKMMRDIMKGGDDQELPVEEDESANKAVAVPLRTGEQLNAQNTAITENSDTDQAPASASKPLTATTPGQSDIERLWADEEKRQKGVMPEGSASSPRDGFRKHFSKKWIIIPIVATLIATAGYAYFTLGTAKIVIHPATKDIQATVKVIASVDVSKIDETTNKIPGQKFQITKDVSGSFPTSVEKDVVQKASGKITITNKDTGIQKLVATTRFESAQGKIFRIAQTITVPGAANGKPSTLAATVYADAPGPDYNITATTFTLPGLKGTPKYTQITASSADPMKGGFIGKAKIVSEQDFIKAKEALTEQLTKAIADAMKQQLTSDLTMLDTPLVTITDPEVNANVGEAADPLTMTLKGNATIIAFRTADIGTLVDRYAKANGDLNVVNSTMAYHYTNGVLDKDEKTLAFDAQITGKSAARIDKDAILKDIPGMDEAKIKTYFQDNKNVETARIQLSPFWVKRIPKDTGKIDISIVTN